MRIVEFDVNGIKKEKKISNPLDSFRYKSFNSFPISGNQLIGFNVDRFKEPSPTFNITLYKLDNYSGYTIEFEKDDYSSLKEKLNNRVSINQGYEIYDVFRKILTEEYNEYEVAFKEYWQKEVKNDAYKFFLEKKTQYSDWSIYYNFYTDKIQDEKVKNGLKAPYSLRNIVTINTSHLEDFTFSNKFILDLIDLKRDNRYIEPDDNRGEYGLYETIYKLAYIKELESGHSTINDEVLTATISNKKKETIEMALNFINPIFNITDGDKLRDVFKNIFEDERITSHLLKNKGDLCFNFTLVYNIIGCFYADKTIKDKYFSTVKDIDFEIAKVNKQLNKLGKNLSSLSLDDLKQEHLTDRRHLISDWNYDKSYIKKNHLTDIVKEYRDKFKSQMN